MRLDSLSPDRLKLLWELLREKGIDFAPRENHFSSVSSPGQAGEDAHPPAAEAKSSSDPFPADSEDRE